MAKLKIEDVFELIARDGLAEAISSISVKRIEDETLATMVEEVQELLNSIEAYVEDHRFEPELEEVEDEEEDDI